MRRREASGDQGEVGDWRWFAHHVDRLQPEAAQQGSKKRGPRRLGRSQLRLQRRMRGKGRVEELGVVLGVYTAENGHALSTAHNRYNQHRVSVA